MIILFFLQCILAMAFIFFGVYFARDAFLQSPVLDQPEMVIAAYLEIVAIVLAASASVTWGAM